MYNTGDKSAIRFVGQENSSNIPVGDHIPVSTGVYIKHKDIILVDDSNNTDKAADHNVSKENIVASSTLFRNIPTEYGGSFKGGDKEDGHREIHNVIWDATFDATNNFNHNNQLFEII